MLLVFMVNRIHAAALVAYVCRLHPETVRGYARAGCPHRRGYRGKLWFNVWEVREWMQETGRSGRPGRPDGLGLDPAGKESGGPPAGELIDEAYLAESKGKKR